MRLFSLIAVLLLSGCAASTIENYVPTVYKVDIQQGNVITQDMVSRLKPGMTKSQVRFVLGSPPITDMFHANRWDYVYTYKKRGTLTEERKLALFFENDLLARVTGDVQPTTIEDKAEEAARPPRAATEIVIDKFDPNAPPKPVEDEKGWFGKMMESVGF